jgi:NaMN:DMB phosphoribosyltransferase
MAGMMLHAYVLGVRLCGFMQVTAALARPSLEEKSIVVIHAVLEKAYNLSLNLVGFSYSICR